MTVEVNVNDHNVKIGDRLEKCKYLRRVIQDNGWIVEDVASTGLYVRSDARRQ